MKYKQWTGPIHKWVMCLTRLIQKSYKVQGIPEESD